MQTGEDALNLDEKRAAVTQILESRTFARSDQLKNFLTYVCEMEFAGRGSEINEYAIGIEALGRTKEYSPQGDSSVRSRAYSLRQKLQEYYEKEQPDARIRVEVPKGSYVPLFVDHAEIPEPPVASEPVAAAVRVKSAPKWLIPAAAFVLGISVWSVVLLMVTSLKSRNSGETIIDPILREAWGPLAHADSNVAVCFGSPPHLHLRSFPGGKKPYQNPPLLDAPPEVAAFYDTFRLNKPGSPVYMYRTNNSLLLGDALAAALAVKTLTRLGASFELLAEKVAGHTALRGRNILRLGSPSDSREVALDLARAPFSIRFDPAIPGEVISDRPPGTANARVFRPKPGPDGYFYGLLTVMLGSSPKEPGTVIASGISSAGADAAIEFFSSPEQLHAMKKRFASDGYKGFPSAYQVILKCVAENGVAVEYEYAGHAVFK